MPTSKPVLCGSIAGSIGGLGIRMHNAAYHKLGLPYAYVSFEPASPKARSGRCASWASGGWA